jgi:hypothetical protein
LGFYRPLQRLPDLEPPPLSLVDWRWARAKGYYNAETREWNEDRGGVQGYLRDVEERRSSKRRKQSSLERPADTKLPTPPPLAVQRPPPSTTPFWVLNEMNTNGLYPIDLFRAEMLRELPSSGPWHEDVLEDIAS